MPIFLFGNKINLFVIKNVNNYVLLKLPGIAHNFFVMPDNQIKMKSAGCFFSNYYLTIRFVRVCLYNEVSFFFGNDSNQIVALQVYFIQVFMVKQLVVVHM